MKKYDTFVKSLLDAARAGGYTVRYSGVVHDHDRGDEDDIRSDQCDQWAAHAITITSPRCAACEAVPGFCAEHIGAVFERVTD